MTEERFALIDGIKPGTHSGIWDNQKQHNQGIGDELWLGEVVGMLNEESILAKKNQRLKEGILWLLEILCKKDPKSDIEFWCQQFFDCNYSTAKEKYSTLSKIMKIE